MKQTTEKDFEDFRDSYRPEQDVVTPIMMEEGHCDDYVYAIPEYAVSLGLIKENPDDQNGGEILEISGDKDNVKVVYLIDFYNSDNHVQSEHKFVAMGKLIKNDDDQVMFEINGMTIDETYKKRT